MTYFLGYCRPFSKVVEKLFGNGKFTSDDHSFYQLIRKKIVETGFRDPSSLYH